MSDASKTTTSNAGQAARNAGNPAVDPKATPSKPQYIIPRKPLGGGTPSPTNHGADGDRSSRDRGEVVQAQRAGQLIPSQLDQTMAQAVEGADAAAAETQRMRAQAAVPQSIPQLHPQNNPFDNFNNFSQFAAQMGMPMHPAAGLDPSTPHGFGGGYSLSGGYPPQPGGPCASTSTHAAPPPGGWRSVDEESARYTSQATSHKRRATSHEPRASQATQTPEALYQKL